MSVEDIEKAIAELPPDGAWFDEFEAARSEAMSPKRPIRTVEGPSMLSEDDRVARVAELPDKSTRVELWSPATKRWEASDTADFRDMFRARKLSAEELDKLAIPS